MLEGLVVVLESAMPWLHVLGKREPKVRRGQLKWSWSAVLSPTQYSMYVAVECRFFKGKEGARWEEL